MSLSIIIAYIVLSGFCIVYGFYFSYYLLFLLKQLKCGNLTGFDIHDIRGFDRIITLHNNPYFTIQFAQDMCIRAYAFISSFSIATGILLVCFTASIYGFINIKTAYYLSAMAWLSWRVLLHYVSKRTLSKAPYIQYYAECTRALADCTQHVQKARFDTFISYKTEAEKYARPIADWLISKGFHPWYDEYLIPLDKTNFNKCLNTGLIICERAIVFLSEGYYDSEWTNKEFNHFAEKQKKLFIIDVREYPDEQLPVFLSIIPRNQYIISKYSNPNLFTEVLDWIGEKESRVTQTNDPDVADDSVNIQEWSMLGLQLNTGHWLRHASEPPVYHCGSISVGEFLYILKTSALSYFNLIIGPAPEEDFTRHNEESNGIIDKRKMQEKMQKLVTIFQYKWNTVSRGCHILYLDEYPKIPQFVISYWRDGGWVRRYSIVLDDDKGRQIEFAFKFEFRGSFQEYFRLIKSMDNVVRSIKWDKRNLIY